MYKKNDKNKQRKLYIIIGIVIVLSILLIYFLTREEKKNPIETLLKDITTFTEEVLLYPFVDLKSNKLEDQSESYLIQKNINESLEKEIQELKEVLELNKTLTEYEPINATILSRNKSYWFNNITIDKGTSNGIEVGMAVITKNGLIGKISSVSSNSSEIKLITSDDINNKVSISIKTNGVDNYAIMNGYDPETGLIKATGIDKTTNINKDDIVLTSGLGNKFPAGIYIGTVEKLESDKYNLSKIVYIKTYQNFNDIHYVTVLKVK